jgi:hypothetical protein
MASPSPRFRSLRIWTSADGRISYYRLVGAWTVGAGSAAQAYDKQLLKQPQFAEKSWLTLDDAHQAIAAYYRHSPPTPRLRALGCDRICGTRYAVREREQGWEVYSRGVLTTISEVKTFQSIFTHVTFPTRRAAGEALVEWLEQYRLECGAS